MLWQHRKGLLLWLLVHLLVSFSLEVHPDTAYYWVWSRRLALGYFDHPPVSAWMLWPVSGPMGLVLMNQLLILFSLVLLLLWVRTVFQRDLPMFWPVVWGLPLLQAGTLAYTPDTPFLFEWMGLMVLVEHWRKSPSHRGYAVAVGLLMGGLVLTKYTALPALAVLLFLSLTPSWRWVWRQGKWMVGAALLVLIPHLFWLFRHDWISWTFQFRHGFGGNWSLRHLPDYLLGQWVVLGPLTVLALLSARRTRALPVHWAQWLRWMAVGVYGFYAWSALRHRVEANWPMVASLSLLLWVWGSRSKPGRWARIAVYINAALLGVLLVHMARPFLPLRRDPARLFHGWRTLAAQVSSRVAPWEPLYANQYQIAAELTLYMHRWVPSLNRQGRPNQYDLWTQERPSPGDTLWWLTEPYTLQTVTVLSAETLHTPLGPRALARVIWRMP